MVSRRVGRMFSELRDTLYSPPDPPYRACCGTFAAVELVIGRAGPVAGCGSLMAVRGPCSGCCGRPEPARHGGRDRFRACRAGRVTCVLWIVAAGCRSGKAGEPAAEQHQVADGRGQGEPGLGEGQAAHGEPAEPDPVLEEAEPAFG